MDTAHIACEFVETHESLVPGTTLGVVGLEQIHHPQAQWCLARALPALSVSTFTSYSNIK